MRSRSLPVVGVLALLALVVLAAAWGSAWTVQPVIFDVPTPEVSAPRMSAPPPGLELPPPAPGPSTPWLPTVLVVVAALVLAVLLVLFVRRLRDRRGEPKGDPVGFDSIEPGIDARNRAIDVPALVDAVDVALARLDAAGTPTDAVVAAWVSLEEAAAQHGWERHPFETSTEFTTRLLGVSPAPPAQTAVLRGLYQQARFTAHPITAGQVAEARSALEAIARALEGRPA